MSSFPLTSRYNNPSSSSPIHHHYLWIHGLFHHLQHQMDHFVQIQMDQIIGGIHFFQQIVMYHHFIHHQHIQHHHLTSSFIWIIFFGYK